MYRYVWRCPVYGTGVSTQNLYVLYVIWTEASTVHHKMRIDSGTVPVHHSPQQQAVSVPPSSDGLPLRYDYGKSSGLTEEVQLLYHCGDCIFWLLSGICGPTGANGWNWCYSDSCWPLHHSQQNLPCLNKDSYNALLYNCSYACYTGS